MKRFLLFLVFIALCGCAAGEPLAPECELFMINVGKGDAILVFVNEDAYLIDTGYAYAWGRVRSAMRELGVEKLKGVFLTHADDDHAGNLMTLSLSEIPVETWYASGCCMEYKEKKHPAVLAAAARGQKVTWLYAGDAVDGVFSVLAPFQLFEDTENNNSLVMRLDTQSGSALLTGDMELPQETALLVSGANVKCDVLKIPNHGDSDATGAQLIAASRASVALISTDPYEKPGTPDAALLSRLDAAGMRVLRTDMSDMGIRATISAGGVRAESVKHANLPALFTAARIASVDAKADTVRIQLDADADLSGWYLYSSRGKEIFVFPEGSAYPAGAITVGSRTTQGAVDMLWDDKNVIHNEKEDTIVLYDAYGRAVSSMGNL